MSQRGGTVGKWSGPPGRLLDPQAPHGNVGEEGSYVCSSFAYSRLHRGTDWERDAFQGRERFGSNSAKDVGGMREAVLQDGDVPHIMSTRTDGDNLCRSRRCIRINDCRKARSATDDPVNDCSARSPHLPISFACEVCSSECFLTMLERIVGADGDTTPFLLDSAKGGWCAPSLPASESLHVQQRPGECPEGA